LYVKEELLDALEEVEQDKPETDTCVEETMLVVGHAISSGPVKRITMKLCGHIGKIEVLILVDSRSVGTFISDQLAKKLQVSTVPLRWLNL
jgi:hypothetical protein